MSEVRLVTDLENYRKQLDKVYYSRRVIGTQL